MNLMTCRLGAGALALLGCCFAACSWSVPADPGENARRAGVGRAAVPASATYAAGPTAAGQDEDPGAGAIYASRCAQCHQLVHPASFSAAEWPTYVDRYGPRAGLYGSERTRVLHWLQAHSR